MRTLPEIVLATRQGRTTKARLPKAWRVRNVTLNTLMKSRGLAPITIVDAKTPEELSDFPELTCTLAERLEGSQPNFVWRMGIFRPRQLRVFSDLASMRWPKSWVEPARH